MGKSITIESPDGKRRAEVNSSDELVTIANTANFANSTVTTVTVTNVSTTVLVANDSRKEVVIFNDSGAIIYIKYGTGCTITSFSRRLANNAEVEIKSPLYTGIITAVRGTGSGDIRVTEVY